MCCPDTEYQWSHHGLSEGYLPEVVATMQREAKAELEQLRVRIYTRWSFAWAVRKN